MNILIATFSFPCPKHNDFGGKFVLTEAKAYSKNGGNVKVLTPHYPDADKKERFDNSIEVIRFKYFWPDKLQKLRKPKEPLYSQKSFLALLQIPIISMIFAFHILRLSRWADVIHAQWTITALLALPAKWLLRKKIVVTARGSDITLLPKWLNRFILKKVDAAIDCFPPQKWVLEYKKNFTANHIKLPLIVEYAEHSDSKEMPTDMKAALKGQHNLFKIIYLGRFDRSKISHEGLPIITLIKAAKILEKKGNNFHIFYIGDGDKELKLEMQEMINELDLNDMITLLGPKINVFDYLPYCDLGAGGVAFNAVSEEFSASKKPQLLVEGYSNLYTPWKDKENALFFEAENVDSLVNAILYAMEDNNRLKKISNNAYQMMSKYVTDVESGGAVYLRAFQKIIDEK